MSHRYPMGYMVRVTPNKFPKYGNDVPLFYFIYLFIFFGPFKNNLRISSRSFIKEGRKPENPEKNRLTVRQQNLSFPDMTRERLEPQW